MDGIRINTARKRLCGFAKLRVYSAQAFFIQKHAGSIALMIEPKVFALNNDERPISRDSVVGRPVLLFDPLLFFRRNNDLMFPAAATTIVATPVLQNRKNDAGTSHDACGVLI